MSQQQEMMAEFLRYLAERDSDNNEEEKDSENEEEKSYGEEDIAQLREAYNNFSRKETFEVGQIVKWKKHLRNRKLPDQNQPAIVVNILDEPIVNQEGDPGTPYFLEKLDIVLGIMVSNGTFFTFYYDSSRFEPY